ncbi:MAG: SPOR domain-containing protein [Planctomycetota bacterium]|jgi:hypothetical protein
MARRRDGRELFEVFKDMKIPPPQAPGAPLTGTVRQPPIQRSGTALHTLRLGDRTQVELFLSLGWVYGTAFFVFLALLGAFVVGRRTAPAPEPIKEVEAPAEFARETTNVVTDTGHAEAPPTAPADDPAGMMPAGTTDVAEPPPAPVTSRGRYTVCVVAYRKKALHRQLAEEFVGWLKEQGPDFADARIVEGRSLNNIYVVIGSFETRTGQEAKGLQSKVRGLTYKGDTFSGAYITTIGSL